MDLSHAPWQLTEDEAADRIASMRKQEDGPYRTGDYMARFERALAAEERDSTSHPFAAGQQQQQRNPCRAFPNPLPQSLPVDAECRSKMVTWSYRVADYCKFSRDTAAHAASLLDRYLDSESQRDRSHPTLRSRRRFQLAYMTALYTSVKVREAEVMEPASVTKLSRGSYREEEVIGAEAEMLRAVSWRVCPPTASEFLRHFFLFVPGWRRHGGGGGGGGGNGTGERGSEWVAAVDAEEAGDVLSRAEALVELSVREYGFVPCRPSTVACAALVNALDGADEWGFPLSARRDFLRKVVQSLDHADVSAFERELYEVGEGLVQCSLQDGQPCSERLCAPKPYGTMSCTDSIASDASTSSPRCVVSRE